MKKKFTKISGKINTAFLLRNFRNLNFEEKAILISNGITFLFCFFPWISVTPIYGNSEFYSAFSGPTKVMGIAIFMLALINMSFFAEKIWQKRIWKIPFSPTTTIGFLSFQQIILIISVWSVLVAFGRSFEDTELRFGISGALFAQVISFTANYLLAQKQKKKDVQDFFNTNENDTN